MRWIVIFLALALPTTAFSQTTLNRTYAYPFARSGQKISPFLFDIDDQTMNAKYFEGWHPHREGWNQPDDLFVVCIMEVPKGSQVFHNPYAYDRKFEVVDSIGTLFLTPARHHYIHLLWGVDHYQPWKSHPWPVCIQMFGRMPSYLHFNEEEDPNVEVIWTSFRIDSYNAMHPLKYSSNKGEYAPAYYANTVPDKALASFQVKLGTVNTERDYKARITPYTREALELLQFLGMEDKDGVQYMDRQEADWILEAAGLLVREDFVIPLNR